MPTCEDLIPKKTIPEIPDTDKATYKAELRSLQIELVKLQRSIIEEDRKLLIIFEGRDSGGKDGTIKVLSEHMSPRETRIVALGKPSDRDRSSWYFQRYVPHLPSGGEIVLFNRSWYNRAGVEKVMGFCTEDDHLRFLRTVPQFENMLYESGITLIKYYLDSSIDEQKKRLQARRDDPLKQWKLSPIDKASLDNWDDYTEAKEAMFYYTDTADAPWTIVKSDDKKRARLNCMMHFLNALDYPGKDPSVVGDPDPLIVASSSRVIQGSHKILDTMMHPKLRDKSKNGAA
ncbi:MAG: polyphosphate kinase 2 [Pseudomonadota bacterium]